ncbi:hypothetical protein BH10PSE14_BH10PSE14_39830 [soil metagenome]
MRRIRAVALLILIVIAITAIWSLIAAAPLSTRSAPDMGSDPFFVHSLHEYLRRSLLVTAIIVAFVAAATFDKRYRRRWCVYGLCLALLGNCVLLGCNIATFVIEIAPSGNGATTFNGALQSATRQTRLLGPIWLLGDVGLIGGWLSWAIARFLPVRRVS